MVKILLWEEGVEWTQGKKLDCSVLYCRGFVHVEKSQMAVELVLIIKSFTYVIFFLFTPLFSIHVNKVSSEHDGILLDCTYIAS